MLTRREFIKKGSTLVAGGIAAASGVLAIVPAEPEEVHPLSARPWIEYGRGMMDGMVEGIASQVGPSVEMVNVPGRGILLRTCGASRQMYPGLTIGDEIRMWVNDVEVTKDIPPRKDTYQMLVQGPYSPSAKYKRTVLTVPRQVLIDQGVSPYLPKVGDNLYLADDSFFGIVVD